MTASDAAKAVVLRNTEDVQGKGNSMFSNSFWRTISSTKPASQT